MCLAIPAQIIALLEQQKAFVSINGIGKKISTSLLDTVAVGDYVIVHVGYALTRLDQTEAEKTLALFAAMEQA